MNSREAAFCSIWSHDKTDGAAADLEMARKLTSSLGVLYMEARSSTRSIYILPLK